MTYFLTAPIRLLGSVLMLCGAPFLCVGCALISIEHRHSDKAAALDQKRFRRWWQLFKVIESTCWTIGTPLAVIGAVVVGAGRTVQLRFTRS